MRRDLHLNWLRRDLHLTVEFETLSAPVACPSPTEIHLFAAKYGDDRSVKIISLEAAKIMKIKWLVLGCIETDLCK